MGDDDRRQAAGCHNVVQGGPAAPGGLAARLAAGQGQVEVVPGGPEPVEPVVQRLRREDALDQPRVGLDGQPAAAGQRLDRLAGPEVRAGDDPGDPARMQYLGQLLGLLVAQRRQRGLRRLPAALTVPREVELNDLAVDCCALRAADSVQWRL
jgi:hypothetical protein